MSCKTNKLITVVFDREKVTSWFRSDRDNIERKNAIKFFQKNKWTFTGWSMDIEKQILEGIGSDLYIDNFVTRFSNVKMATVIVTQ